MFAVLPRYAGAVSIAFLKEFIRDPIHLGAVAPSSPRLARTTVGSAGIRSQEVVVELGAGTGPMTAALVEEFPSNPLMCLEPNPRMAERLRDRFPTVHVRANYVQELPVLMEEWGHPSADRIVSSLPWAIWSPELQQACFEAILQVMSPTGSMVTFQYAHSQMLPAARRFKRTLRSHFHEVNRTSVVWANLPPAFVYVCEQPRQP